MAERLQAFWTGFWHGVNQKYNQAYKNLPVSRTQSFRDIKRLNFLAVFVTKLNNLANTEATFELEGGRRTRRLKELCKDLEDKRFSVTADMLADGDVWVFPALDRSGNLYHRALPRSEVRIIALDGAEVTDIIGVIDEYTDEKNRTYLLNRRHTLSDGTLTVETFVTDSRGRRVFFSEWADIESVYVIKGAQSVGVGRFRSPASSRGHSPVYGVPLNFGCEEIENRCFRDIELIETEYERAESKLFADGRALRKIKGERGEEFRLFEGVYSVERRAGDTGNIVDIFSPEIRSSAYYTKLMNDLAQYEQQVGTDKGFLTPADSGRTATATEIRRSNASTIALLDKIRTSIRVGVEQTLSADALFLNIPREAYSVKFDFFDPFTDENAQYQRLANAVDRGVAEKTDELRWLFPSLSAEERAEKLARIEGRGE